MTFQLTPALRQWLVDNSSMPATATDDLCRSTLAKALGDGSLGWSKFRELVDAQGQLAAAKQHVINQLTEQKGTDANMTANASSPTVDQVLGSSPSHLRVKNPSESYCQKRTTGVHIKTGQPVQDERGRTVELPSQCDLARIGALCKWHAARDGLSIAMSEHEKALLEEMFAKDVWVGMYQGRFHNEVPGMAVKALLSDSLSGGINLNPHWFDDAIIQKPLLNGELYPFVDLRPIPRGNVVDGASISNPTVQWGIGDGTEVALFDTASLVSQISTTIYPVACAITLGRDFLSDAAVEVGRIVEETVGRRMVAEFDKVIAVGVAASSQPTGIFNASGIGSVSTTGGAGAAAQITDYEKLMFAVGKQYRIASLNMAYIANDVSYQRARSIAVGAADARRVFGMDHGNYTLLDHPYRIQPDIPNAKIAFGALKLYRLYRREGIETRWEEGGESLARSNQALLIVRARLGGQVVDASAFAAITDAQA